MNRSQSNPSPRVQAGFDILDNEVNKLGRLETVGLLEPSNHRVDKKDLNTLLLTFGARPSERDISQILQEQVGNPNGLAASLTPQTDGRA